MAVRFTLEKRTNLYGECPIRISWAFGGFRYQTTLGFSIKAENWDSLRKEVKAGTHNLDGVKADEINDYIKRIKRVVSGIETYYKARNGSFIEIRMKEAIKDAKSSKFHIPFDIIEKWTVNAASTDDSRKRYFRSGNDEYYTFICNAFDQYNRDEFYILQEMFGSTKRIIVPKREFEKRKDGSMWATTKLIEVTEDEALGRGEKVMIFSLPPLRDSGEADERWQSFKDPYH